MRYSPHDVARAIDVSVLKFDTTQKQVDDMIAACIKYDIGCAFAMPSYSAYLGQQLAGTTTEFGTSLGFPSGQYHTSTKVQEAIYFESLGADQIDMVMNVGWLKSGMYEEALADLVAVRKAAAKTSLKVIIEASLLTDEEIKKACRVVIDSGADYVKSGTGFSPPTTMHHVNVMNEAIAGFPIKFKVAGGVKDLRTLVEMKDAGVDRFGIGLVNTLAILEQAQAYPDGVTLAMLDSDSASSKGEEY